MLSLLLRCCGMSVGVLAFNSLTLFMVVPGCVWICARVCMCLSRWSLLFLPCVHVCVCVCVRCVLAAVSYSGSRGVPGVSVWLSPPAWAPSAGPGGQLSPGLFAGSWSSAGLWARRSEVGVEGEDQGSSQGAGTRPVQDQGCLRDYLLRQAWEEGKHLRAFILFGGKQIDIQLLYVHTC